jgi:hypothetical protein
MEFGIAVLSDQKLKMMPILKNWHPTSRWSADTSCHYYGPPTWERERRGVGRGRTGEKGGWVAEKKERIWISFKPRGVWKISRCEGDKQWVWFFMNLRVCLQANLFERREGQRIQWTWGLFLILSDLPQSGPSNTQPDDREFAMMWHDVFPPLVYWNRDEW